MSCFHGRIALTFLCASLIMGCSPKESKPQAPVTPAAQGKAIKETKSVAKPGIKDPLITTKKADPSRMPRDRIHAPFLKRSPSNPHAANMPKGHPPTRKRGPMMAPAGPTDKHATLPLPLEGAGGANELKTRLVKEADLKIKKRIDEAFRKTFTVTRSSRNPSEAATLLNGLTAGTAGATASRIMGYVAIQTRQGFGKALEYYKKAVALDANYGEAHYALAFTYVISDRTTGAKHFKKAMDLGVKDTRGLGLRYYKASK
jgi:hypothetical protein